VQVPHAVEDLFIRALPLPHREPGDVVAPAGKFSREQAVTHLPAADGIRY
jgi:hypothetical protein